MAKGPNAMSSAKLPGDVRAFAKAGSILAAAAAALDAELARYADLAAEVERMPLTSEKNLNRAARALAEAAESQERVGGHVASLVAAITTARIEQQTSAERLLARAQEIQRRVNQLEALTTRFAQLGQDARAMNALVQEAAAPVADARSPEGAAELAARLSGIDTRMGEIIDSARDLSETANAEEMSDVGQKADSLRQQLQAARNKVKLLQKSFTPVGSA